MTNQPTPEQIRKALEQSGYLMEQRLHPILEKAGYFVTPGHEYEDPDTGKSREIDIHALSVISLYRLSFRDMLSITLLVACKNNHLPIVVFTYENLLQGIEPATPITKAGYPLEISATGMSQSIEEFLRLGEFHHFYRAKRLGAQYCRITEHSRGGKNQAVEYRADHGDLYADLESLVKAVEAELAKYRDVALEQAAALNGETKEDDINLVFVYPVMVFSGDIYECRQKKQEAELVKANHILMVRRIESRSVKGEFLVDMVRESYFGNYLRRLTKETDLIAKCLRKNRRVLRKNVVRELQGAMRKAVGGAGR